MAYSRGGKMDANAVKVRFEIKGAAVIEKKMRQLGSDVRFKVARRACRNSGKVLLGAARQTAPVGTKPNRKNPQEYQKTHLRDHIKISVRRLKKDRDIMSALVGPDKDHFYGKFTQYGARGTPKNEWLTRAFDGARGAATAALYGTFRKFFAKGRI